MQENGNIYSSTENEISYQNPMGKETKLSLDAPLRVKISWWAEQITFKGHGGKIPLSPLSNENQHKIFIQFFERWKSRSPDAAKKAAFDYIDGQKGFVPVAMAACLLISLPFSVGLLNDSREQMECTDVLRHSSALGEMQVVKFKKKRKGHYILNLQFTTPEGKEIIGTDQLITEDETTIPKSVPVVYSPENIKCWSLTPSLQGKEPNWAKRRYFATVTCLFGLFFMAISAYGLLWAIARWRQKRPYTSDLKKLFGF